MYLIYGDDQYLINRQKEKIIKNYQMDQGEIEVYNYYDNSLATIIASANTSAMFATHKIIIVEDCYFLTEEKNQSKFYNSDISQELIKYLHHPNDTTILIFLCPTSNLSKRLKITKDFLSLLKVLEVNVPDLTQLALLVKQYITQHDSAIAESEIKYFLSLVPHNLMVIRNELQKLILRSDTITKELIEDSVGEYYETDVFQTVNSLLLGDIQNFVRNYYHLLNTGINLMALVGLLSSNIILIRNILLLKAQNYQLTDIGAKLGVHPYRLKKINEYVNHFSISQCNKMLKEMAQIDYLYKKGIINSEFPNIIFLIKLL